ANQSRARSEATVAGSTRKDSNTGGTTSHALGMGESLGCSHSLEGERIHRLAGTLRNICIQCDRHGVVLYWLRRHKVRQSVRGDRTSGALEKSKRRCGHKGRTELLPEVRAKWHIRHQLWVHWRVVRCTARSSARCRSLPDQVAGARTHRTICDRQTHSFRHSRRKRLTRGSRLTKLTCPRGWAAAPAEQAGWWVWRGGADAKSIERRYIWECCSGLDDNCLSAGRDTDREWSRGWQGTTYGGRQTELERHLAGS